MTDLRPTQASPRTIGVEEEVILLEPDTLSPIDVADEVIGELVDLDASASWITHEFLRAQLEFSSPVLADGDAAERVVRAFRDALSQAAARRSLIPASVGTAHGRGASSTAEGDRYLRFDSELGAIRPDHQIQGLHVHVAITSRNEGVTIMRALRPWLAPLLALTANSPSFAGADTGFASWRTMIGRRFTTASAPPIFADAEDYERRSLALVGLGTTFDTASLAWMMRLAERWPTIELRLFDAQLSAGETVATALLARALVEVAAAGELPHAEAAAQPELVDSAIWHAARHGLDDGLVDPTTARLTPAWEVIDRMVEAARPALQAAGDEQRVDALIARVRAEGNGATRQRAALAEGEAALGRLLRESFSA
ncbi:carboxylate-amine ligase [Agrococcus sp. KRD186]|uniref:carboxylate-amine ligase n=1 Tax=Agrococcus sp. KRD186 TaxID=2729730 RepID=UPI0019CFD67E|nr:YbdK family carboxylate-amine ligase [Agrococcus sp. KRD186]